MNEFLGTFIMYFSFLYLIEGIEICIQKRGNKTYRGHTCFVSIIYDCNNELLFVDRSFEIKLLLSY